MTTPNDTPHSNAKPPKKNVSTQKTPPKEAISKETTAKAPLTRPKAAKQSMSSIAIIATISSLAALGLGMYSVNKIGTIETRMQAAQAHHNQSRQQIVNSIQTKLLSQENQFQTKLSVIESEQVKRMTFMEQSLTELNKNTRGDDQSWKLQKTAYLLNMAQLTLRWEKTPASSIELLTAADDLIKSLNNPRLIGLRQSISNELLSLKSMPKFDTIRLLSELSAISQLVETLPIKKTMDKQATGKAITHAINPNAPTPAWKSALNASFNALSQLIVIRKHNQPYQPLMSHEDKLLITHQMQLSVKQAQWALIHQKSDVYDFSLKEIQQLLNTYFDDKASSTQAMSASLSSLMQEKVMPTLPSIGRSYQQLMEIIKTQNAPHKTEANA